MRESKIEKYLTQEVKKIGGESIKINSPGLNGMPDRWVGFPGGKMFFIEMKAPGKLLTKQQQYRAKQLRDMGFDSRKIDSKQEVDIFIWEAKHDHIQST